MSDTTINILVLLFLGCFIGLVSYLCYAYTGGSMSMYEADGKKWDIVIEKIRQGKFKYCPDKSNIDIYQCFECSDLFWGHKVYIYRLVLDKSTTLFIDNNGKLGDCLLSSYNKEKSEEAYLELTHYCLNTKKD